MLGMRTSKDPSPHPPKTPVIIAGIRLIVSQRLISKSLNDIRFYLFQAAIAKTKEEIIEIIKSNELCTLIL